MIQKNQKTKQFNGRGFTLIELLAVIVILAIIALIATPIVLNIINKSKKSAFTDTAYGIIESARLYYTDQILDGGIHANKEFKFDGSNSELKFNGTVPKGGSLILTSNGEVSLAIHNGVWCASKARNESKVTLKKYEESTCLIPDDIEVPDTPVTPDKKGVSIEEKVNTSTEIMTNDPDGNRRYVGSNPSNYVKFNNELWRIIGIFNGQAKIIRNEFYSTGIAWDKNSSNGGHGSYGYNDWSTATLQAELNGTYLNGIEETSRGMIDESHVWKLGGTPNSASEMTRAKMYGYERGTTVYTGRPTEWTGAIGLMYASDYGYSTSATDAECESTTMNGWSGSGNVANCKNNSWLTNSSNHQWTISPASSYENYVFYVNTAGSVNRSNANNTNGVRPVLYLKSSVKITSGEGTVESPFEFTA